jgi:hypothetical protein
LRLAKRQSILFNKKEVANASKEVEGVSIDDSREDNEEVDENRHA